MSKLRFGVEKLLDADRTVVIDTLARFGLPDDTMVHAAHCTVEGGCKYGDYEEPNVCPVVSGLVRQVYEYDPEWN